jgi:pyruvate dehydrogenase E1 component alpha subunit
MAKKKGEARSGAEATDVAVDVVVADAPAGAVAGASSGASETATGASEQRAPDAEPHVANAAERLGDDAALNREMLRSMLLQRRFEERTAEAYAIGRIGGFCHLYIGQEAVSAGVESVLRPDDYVITTYRDHGQALARGMTPRAVMAELFGRSDGCARGKGG